MDKKVVVSIKKMTSDEANVSKRNISYDVYHDGKYHKTFNDVNDALDHKEKMHKEELELDEKVLNIQQRQKRAQIMRRYKSKIERARELAKKRMAPEANIRKRAFAQARQIVRRRVAGTRGAEYEKLGPSEKIAIDRAVEGKQEAIKKLALRLIPRVKQAESKRLHSFMAGHQMQNQGQPEGKSKESSGTSSVKEDLNDLFTEAFPQADVSNALGQRVDNPITSSNKKMPAKGKSNNSAIIQHNKFNEEVEFDTPAFASLFNKSEKSGIDLEILGEVYNRGWNTWSEDCKVSQQQYAFARVNSYINQGKTYFNEDSDLHEKGLWDNIHAKRKRMKAGSSERMRKPGSEGAPTKKNFKDASESVEESNNTPFVKAFAEKGSKEQLGWKASNKHGKVKYFGKEFKSAAHRHAGLQEEEVQQTNENFIDGKGPGRPGDSARHGLKGKSTAELKKIRSSDTASPRKKQLAHFMLNMTRKESVDEELDKNHPIVKEYNALKKHDIKTLRSMISRSGGVVDTSGFGSKDQAVSHLIRSKHGNKNVDKAFGFAEDTENGTQLLDKISKNSKIRNKIEKVDRARPHGELSKQTEIIRKVVESHTDCGTPECCGQCDTVVNEKLGNVQNDPKKREIGTDSLVKAYKADTPYASKNINESFNIAFAAGVGVTLTAADLGMKVQSGFALHPSVIKEIDEMEEEVRTADVKGVVVHTASGKTIVRKQKVNQKIIGTGNLTDGKPDDTV